MNSFNATHDDLNMLLDGELTPPRETEVYKLLMEESAVRAQFHRLLLIRSTVQQDMEQLAPSEASREAIFGALGFSAAPAGPAAIEASRAAAWWSRLPGYLTAAVVGAVGMYLFLMNQTPDPQPAPISTVAQSTGAARPVAPSHTPSAAPAVQVPATVTADAAPPRQHVQYAPRHRSEIKAVAADNSVTMIDTASGALGSGTLRDGEDIGTVVPRSADHGAVQQTFTEPPIVVHSNTITLQQIVTPDAELSPVALQLRGMSARSFPGATIAPQSNPWFQDMAISASYMLDAHHSIGIEAGQEAVMQQYSGIEHDSTVRYEQNPMMAWGGLQYQYSSSPIAPLGGIRIYGSLLAGATKFGPLGRVGAGLQYHLDKRVRLLAGIEGTGLFYEFQNQWFMSRKLGFTYGIVWQL
jgi:anti-sigma factor RsiW